MAVHSGLMQGSILGPFLFLLSADDMAISICWLSMMIIPTNTIMVKFGTNPGPIIPRKNRTTTVKPDAPENPAPVTERIADNPNPSTYKPLVPHQYRTKLYSYRPSPNLILGTPIDQKYTPSLQKYDIYRKQARNYQGVGATGPHQFERQQYEYEDSATARTVLQPSVHYIKPHYYQELARRNDNIQQNKYVPEIGIIYSAGVKYYVPQLVYYNEPVGREENSVYDSGDEKYYHHNRA